MLLTITTTHQPATDLGYLLHKHPGRIQSVALSFGQAHVFYPEAGPQRCTAAPLLDVDPVGLVRGKGDSEGLLDQYVNDRPYTASSLMSVALSQVFGTAMGGRSKHRPDLAAQAIPLEVSIAVLPCHGGEAMVRSLFEPLGYEVHVTQHPLDEAFAAWGESPYHTVILRATVPLWQLLAHLYVLIPVLDNDKHYYIGQDEVAKLLRHGEGWLAGHPQRELITRRYLKRSRPLIHSALARLGQEDTPVGEAVPAGEGEDGNVGPGDNVQQDSPGSEHRSSLHEQRLQVVLAELKSAGARRVLDLGCGEGRLLKYLLADPSFSELVGLDASHQALERARDRLHLDQLPTRLQGKVRLLHGSLTYRDRRLEGFDAAAIVEMIEHLDPSRLAAFERVVFACARPETVIVTTPNVEYNVLFPTLPQGSLRHRDHRFEWTRGEFAAWANGVAERFSYTVRLTPLGPEDPGVGAPSQMGVFQQC